MVVPWPHLGVAGLVLAALTGCGSLPPGRQAEAPSQAPEIGRFAPPPSGPTLRLDVACSSNDAVGIPVREFMYFIPLISPEPVDCTISLGSTQRATLKSLERSGNGSTFALRCRFALVGAGALQNDYDHAPMVSRNADFLRGGGRLSDILGYIRIEGEGDCTLEGSGEYVDGVPVMQRVSMAFTGVHGSSPVRIGLNSISGTPEAWRARADSVAYVASLAFARTAAPSSMEVTLASLRDAQAGDTLADQLKGALKGAIANLFIPPVGIEASGNLAMLDFAAALFAGTPTFAFPLAPNLRSITVSPALPAGQPPPAPRATGPAQMPGRAALTPAAVRGG